MNIRLAKENEVENWDKLILANLDGGNIVQGDVLAKLKQNQGWRIFRLMFENLAITVYEKPIFGLGKLWYIPKGPGVSSVNELKNIVGELKLFAKKHGVFLIKVEPEILKNTTNLNSMKKLGHPAGSIQPNTNTIYIHIAKDTEKMLSLLNQKTRHAINRARRDGLAVKQVEVNDKNCKVMLGLMKETMSGRGVLMRDDAYYIDYWKTYAEANQGELFVAYDADRPIAAAYILVYGNKATYKDGGSTREKSIYGASHALQWSIVESLSKRKITSYDLCGSPPASEIGNPKHPHYGIGLFKSGFNKEVTEYVGVYDIPVNNLKYDIWKKLGERLIHKYYKVILKKLFY